MSRDSNHASHQFQATTDLHDIINYVMGLLGLERSVGREFLKARYNHKTGFLSYSVEVRDVPTPSKI
jgi:hypothetical protein